jgi:hypothetical protein
MIVTADFNFPKLDGMEVQPGITLMGEPTWHENEWRCLANVCGYLAVIVLNIKVVGKNEIEQSKTQSEVV